MGTNRRWHCGYTLIELLIVVVIIAILISTLLPALAQSREYARRTVCANALRQISMGFFFYCSDHGDYLPGFTGFEDPQTRNKALYWFDFIGAYLPSSSGDQTVYQCPSSTSYRIGWTYGYNYQCLCRKATQPLLPEAEYVPQKLILVADSAFIGIYYNPNSGDVDPVHIGGTNYLFLDAHVEWYPEMCWEKFKADELIYLRWWPWRY